MKKLSWILSASLLVAGAVFCGGCSDDEDDGGGKYPLGLSQATWDVPSYLDDAALYVVSGSSEIGSIELVANGYYMVLPPETGASVAKAERSRGEAAVTRPHSIFRKNRTDAQTRTIETYRTHFGTYTKIDDGAYELADFGIIRILEGDDRLLITRTGQTGSAEYAVERIANEPADDVTMLLCQAWHPVSANMKIYANGKLVYTEAYATEEDMREEFVDYVVLTNNTHYSGFEGSYVQVDYGNYIDGCGDWKWADRKNQQFSYQWRDIDEPGIHTGSMYFMGNNTMYFMEETVGYEDGEKYTEVYVVKCELKH